MAGTDVKAGATASTKATARTRPMSFFIISLL
jgi:hypothetical protein